MYWHDLSSFNPTSTPTSGSGTIAPVAPGFRSTGSFYSFTNHFGATATTTAAFDISNVVFQLVGMQNPDYSVDQTLSFSAPTVFSGNPIRLSYTIGGDTFYRTATDRAITNFGADVTIGPFSGDLYTYAWQWDLSDVVGTITSITIEAPIIVHSATANARIDISDNYERIIVSVPEPSTYAMIAFGVGALLVHGRRRMKVKA